MSTSFNVAFESLVPLIACYWLRDTRAAVLTASALTALVFGSVSGFAAALLLQLVVVAISVYTLVASSW